MGNIRILYTDKKGTDSIIVVDGIQYLEDCVRLYAENVYSSIGLQMTKEEYSEVIIEAFKTGSVDLRKYKDVTDEEYYEEYDFEEEDDYDETTVDDDDFFNSKGCKIIKLFRGK